MSGWWITIRELGSDNRLPFAPAERRNCPALHASPRARVATSFGISRMTSRMASIASQKRSSSASDSDSVGTGEHLSAGRDPQTRANNDIRPDHVENIVDTAFEEVEPDSGEGAR